ncbi:MAG: MBL fold metallo-hydrolase, partial [Acidobacteriota bacterium]|nr:MBL fold metallo-hydrolase [Acidobacteriota bacterium]
MSSRDFSDPNPAAFRLHLLDVGVEKYADAVLIEFGATKVLIDGAHTGDHDGSEGHPSIPEQLQKILGDPVPRIDLLIVSHLHEDHIGCLPRLVSDGILRARWALVVHPDLGWPRGPVDAFDAEADFRVLQVVAGLREEPRLEELDGRSVDSFLADAAALEGSFRKMLDDLDGANTRIVRYTGESDADVRELLDEFEPIGLKVIGPDDRQMLFCADKLDAGLRDAVR